MKTKTAKNKSKTPKQNIPKTKIPKSTRVFTVIILKNMI